MNNDTPLMTRRRPFAMLVSGLLHAGLALFLMRLTFPETQPVVEYRMSLVFAPKIAPPPTRIRPFKPLAVAAPSVHPPLLVTEPTPIPVTSGPIVQPVPPPHLEAAPPAARVVSAVELPTPPPVVKPAPQVGSFGESAISAASNIAKPVPLHVGSFEGGPQAVERATTHASGVVRAGFGISERVEASAAGQPAAPRATGTFGSIEAGAPRHAPKQAVANTQFDTVVVTAPSAKPSSASGGVQTALEILQKPVPIYTSEARLRKLEGEVLLEALFSATGQVRVLRVLRGLGYGLDENAIQAAANIRFRPATERSQPVDTVAMVRIGFQLAY